MITKKIHYLWFGNARHPNVVKKCLKSWKDRMPEYKTTLWNEQNYNINHSDFTKKAFAEKKWAFLSDYARLDVLYREGGIYLDTDMEVLKPLDNFLEHGLFLGMESEEHVNASILGAVPGHWLIKEVLNEYESLTEYTPIPVIMTKVLQRYMTIENRLRQYKDVTIYPSEYFYPVAFGEQFNQNKITPHTHTIHWWDHSWGSRRVRLLKKIGLLKTAQWLKNKLS